jgi:GAF domain-containing protein
LSGATDLLPLSFTLLAALLLYVAARNVLMRQLIFTPLICLTQSVSVAKTNAVDIFGNERDDEIGDLARAVREMGERLKASSAELLHTPHEQQRQARFLNAVNSATAALLAATDVDNFEASLTEGMEFMGRCVDIDRIQIWRNKMINGTFFHVHQYEWLNDIGRQKTPVYIGEKFPYNEEPEWEAKFARGECVNGPLSSLSPHARELLQPYGIRSVLRIPVHVQERFWGIVSFNDCRQERAFTEDEVNLLRSVSLMLVNAVNRHEQAIKTQERSKLMLDAIPLPCHLWDADLNLFECNAANVKFFGVSDRQEFFDHFSAFSPEYQPDGRLSSEAAAAYIKKAFEEDKCVFEWMHQTLDGTPLLSEITLVRVAYGHDYAVIGYVRDLREQKQMNKAIQQRDTLLEAVYRTAEVLLQPETDDFASDLHRCMGMMAEAVDADRAYIWKNHTVNGRLYCTQLCAWPEGVEPQQGSALTVHIAYSEHMPEWEETLSSGQCINAVVRDMSPAEQAQISPRGILSLFVAPVFFRGHFWGFVGYDDCHSERIFSENEQSILRSGGLLIANALLRNDNVTEMLRLQAELKNTLPGAQAADPQSGFLHDDARGRRKH